MWAHRWFVGPVREIQAAQRLGVDPLEPGALERAEMEVGEKDDVETSPDMEPNGKEAAELK